MDTLFDAFKYLARRFHGRWSRLDDVLLRIRAHDDGGRSPEGERARRTLDNAFRVQSYVGPTRDALYTDRSNALRKLGQPLAEALGHIVTIELADQMLEALDVAEHARWRERGDAEAEEGKTSPYGPLIDALHRHGVDRGNYNVLTDVEARSNNVLGRSRPSGRHPKHGHHTGAFIRFGIPIVCRSSVPTDSSHSRHNLSFWIM